MKTKPCIICWLALFFPFILEAQTVVYYHCDGTNGTAAGTIVDSGPSGWNGSMVGTADYAPGLINSCLDLSGDLNYVTIPQSSSLVLSNSWTVEMLFRLNVPYTVYGSDPASLINKLDTPNVGNFLDSFGIQVGTAGIIYTQIGFGNLTGQALSSGSHGNYADGQWHHVALVYSVGETSGTNTISLYTDYALTDSASGAFPPIYWANFPINIGAGNYPANQANSQFRRNFDGQVDEVRVSDAALTPNQFVGVPPGHIAPLAIQLQGAGVLLSWGSTSNETYRLQTRTNLNLGTWMNLGGPRMGTGSGFSMPDPFVPGRGQSFYHLLATP